MKEITFTKIIMLFISFVWFLSLLGCYINPERQFIMEYTNYAFVSGVIGYVVKSGVENVFKIKQSNDN